MNTVERLMDIENRTYDKFEVTSRPYGDKYINMVLDIATQIISSIPVDELSQDVINTLEDFNYHMVNHAIKAVKNIDKYSGREYINA